MGVIGERSHVAKGIGGNQDGLSDGDVDTDCSLILAYIGTSDFRAVGPPEGIPEILLGSIFPGMLGDGDFKQPVGTGHRTRYSKAKSRMGSILRTYRRRRVIF